MFIALRPLLVVRRATEVAKLATNDVDLDSDKGVVDIRVVGRKDGKVGAGRAACLVAILAWGDACPAHILAD